VNRPVLGAEGEHPSRHRGLTSRASLDDLCVQEPPGELDVERGIGSGVLGAEFELGVGEAEPAGVDQGARRADDEQPAVDHVRVDSQSPRSDHRMGEVKGDPAELRAKLDARRYLPAAIQDVLAAVLLEYERFLGCGRAWQVGGEPGQFAERPSGKGALQPGVKFLGAYVFDQVQSAGAAQTPQRWLYGAEGQILLARSPAGAAAVRRPPGLLQFSICRVGCI
jgi:hypothetical protein